MVDAGSLISDRWSRYLIKPVLRNTRPIVIDKIEIVTLSIRTMLYVFQRIMAIKEFVPGNL